MYIEFCVNLVLLYFSPSFNLDFSLLVKRLPGKSISNMTYSLSSGTLNLNAVNEWNVRELV